MCRVEPAPCSRTALVRDRYIDEIKAEMKEERFKKVDDGVWDDIVARMKERERKRVEYDKKDTTVTAEIYLTVLKDEIVELKSRLESTETGYLIPTISTLQQRVREMEND